MLRLVLLLLFSVASFSILTECVGAADINQIFETIHGEISGNRARDYAMRLWQYDKWSTLPMWKKSAGEAQTIMRELRFDEAEIVETPADGVTKYGDWTNPLGWDVKQATLEVIEPPNLPDEYRYLCNYRNNPTSLNSWSCPTPPEGIEAELVLLEKADSEELSTLDARGKIILVSSNSRGLKRYLDPNGILGIVSDETEYAWKDIVTVNRWLNGWSDLPGGWLLTASDSKNNFGFSISQIKGKYLRSLLRQGKTVKVLAKIDSRYFTDDTLPYVTGYVRGAGTGGEEILVGGHIFEWGASDNASGVGSILEAVGTLNELIRSGILTRPQRSIRVWFGHEIYGSLAFATHNLERLRKKTVAALCCDDGGANYDLSSTEACIYMNPDVCPSFTDAVITEIARHYYSVYSPHKSWKIRPFRPLH